MIPAEWDGVERQSVLGVYDPREVEGELICPERFGKKEITELKQLLGTYGTAGQLQQDPTPSEGGILRTQFFELWPHDQGLPHSSIFSKATIVPSRKRQRVTQQPVLSGQCSPTRARGA